MSQVPPKATAAEPAAAPRSSTKATGEGSGPTTRTKKGVSGTGQQVGSSEQSRRGTGRPRERKGCRTRGGGGGGLLQGGWHPTPPKPQAAWYQRGRRWGR